MNYIVFIGLSFIISFLGAYSGSTGTSLLWRRMTIPLIFVAYAYIVTQSLWSILLMAVWGGLSMGYGIPDATDEGSTIARICYKVFKKNHKLADIFTRGTIGFFICIPFLVFPIISNNWVKYIICTLCIILTYALNSWRSYGTITFKYKDKIYYLLNVDLVTYLVLGLCGLSLI